MTAPSVDDPRDLALIAALRDGLPLCARPYAELGARLGLGEDEVIARLRALCDSGAIRRFGAIVRHHEAGYTANAMVVFDIPDAEVSAIGRALATEQAVTLCYRRSRALPEWRYNLYCMVHGKDRAAVRAEVREIVERQGLAQVPCEILFSSRRFKQTAGLYGRPQETVTA